MPKVTQESLRQNWELKLFSSMLCVTTRQTCIIIQTSQAHSIVFQIHVTEQCDYTDTWKQAVPLRVLSNGGRRLTTRTSKNRSGFPDLVRKRQGQTS